MTSTIQLGILLGDLKIIVGFYTKGLMEWISFAACLLYPFLVPFPFFQKRARQFL